MFPWYRLKHGVCLRLYAHTAGWPQQRQNAGKERAGNCISIILE